MTHGPTVLVISGSDSSGGAGMQRDLRVLAKMNVKAACVVTALTAQSHARVRSIHTPPPEFVAEQIAAAFEAGPVDAVKIGMLGTRETVMAVAGGLQRSCGAPIVLDTVMAASSGALLLGPEGLRALRDSMFPDVALLTPNLPEAAVLLGEPEAKTEAEMIGQCHRLHAAGSSAVLLKGGHGSGDECVDYLFDGQRPPLRLAAPRLHATMRGTGCALSSAIAARLALGDRLPDACRRAKSQLSALLAAVAPHR